MVLGAVGPAKANAARRCAVGNFLCVKAVATTHSVPKALVGVYADEADAKAIGAFLQDSSDTSLQAAHDDALSRELHTEAEVPLSILKAMAANWRHFVGGGGGGGAVPVDPLVGTFFPVVNFIVVDNAGTYTGTTYTGDIRIVSAINDDTFACEFDHEGVTYTQSRALKKLGSQRCARFFSVFVRFTYTTSPWPTISPALSTKKRVQSFLMGGFFNARD